MVIRGVPLIAKYKISRLSDKHVAEKAEGVVKNVTKDIDDVAKCTIFCC
jgi:hypothetical protein